MEIKHTEERERGRRSEEIEREREHKSRFWINVVEDGATLEVQMKTENCRDSFNSFIMG
jgi:hypothetical protein